MAIPTDPVRKSELMQVVGRRLKAARRAAGMSQAQAAHVLRHKGITQVSLAEDGKRLPPIFDLVKYADLYSVPLDFLVGRIDDPLMEAGENNQGIVVRTVTHGIQELFGKFATAVAGHVSVSISGIRGDRRDMVKMIGLAEEAEVALRRLKELNPGFEEDMRGSSRLDSILRQFAALGRDLNTRTKRERLQYAMIDRALEMEAIEGRVCQFQLALEITRSEEAVVAEAVA
jgi:transcriptional regulator with XRE-family HTH domain